MASVQSTTSSNNIFAAINAAAQSGSTTTSSTAQEAENRFLKLLVTQLQNQDPLNPLDNAEMTSQLAQMSTVSGIEKLNATLSTLMSSISDTQSMQAAEMIGKTVLVSGNQLTLNNGAAYAGVNLSAEADQVTVSIFDSAGNIVRTEKLGAQKTGVINFSWDGKTDSGTQAAAGIYKFSVEAVSGGEKVTVKPLQFGTVSALVRTTGGFKLDLGLLGNVDFTDVQQIL